MTLIISWSQDDMVLQLSDRRLSLPGQDGESGIPLPDPVNKSVLFNGRVIFGFTGRSLVEGKPTDIWIAERLVTIGDDLDAAIDLLRADLQRAFRRPDHASHWLGIAMCGFFYDNDVLRPFQGVISNRTRDDWLPPYSRRFKCDIAMHHEPEHSGIQAVPNWLSPSEIAELHESIPSGCNQFELVSRIARAIRRVADDNPEVGHDLMLSSMPISAAYRLNTYSVSDGMPNRDRPTFAYLSHTGESVMYAPTLVMAGQVIAGVKLVRGKPWKAWR